MTEATTQNCLTVFKCPASKARYPPETHAPRPANMSEAPQEEVASSTFSTQPVDTDGARTIYTIPGVLHFLQHEWARFERERSNWEVERAELKVHTRFFRCLVFR